MPTRDSEDARQANAEPAAPPMTAPAGKPAWWWRPRPGSFGHDPDYRFSLANERTFLAWTRTSLALLATGVAVRTLVPPFTVPGGREALAGALVVLSLLLSSTSYLRWLRNERAMRLNEPLPPSVVPPLLMLGMTGVTLFAFALVLLHD